MKILHYINNLGSGGAERLLTFVLPLLKEKGHEVHLAYANNEKNIKSFEEQLLESGIKIHNFNLSRFSPINILKIRKLINKEKFDIVHAHLFPTQYWLAIGYIGLSKKTHLIKTEHNTHNGRRDIKILKPIDTFIYKRYEHLIAITEEVKENLDNWTGMNTKTTIIKNGVALDHVRNALDNYNKSEYSFLNENNVNLLMVGRFDGEAKDQISLIESLKYLPENYHIYFAGEGNLIDLSIKKVTELGLKNRVHFLGMRTDVYLLMNLVDINILSTNFEGLSGVALESMASSKPFIGSDVPGIKDIVPNKEFLFPKKAPKELAKKIINITNDSLFQKKLVQEANLHVKDYDIKKMAIQHETLYNSLLK